MSACEIRTAVQTESLPSLCRVRQTQKVMARIRPLIAAAQVFARSVELYNLSLQAVVDGAQSPEVTALPASLRRRVLFDRATTAANLGGAYLLSSGTGHRSRDEVCVARSYRHDVNV